MGYLFGEAKQPCPKNMHHFMRYATGKNCRFHPVPVGVKAPLPSDFCSYCRILREELLPPDMLGVKQHKPLQEAIR